ncbi:hypothetical protein CSA56_13990 [candidate division KSB3 bacterium]|uniref:Uncharacterized protein n=1 Tax=candidate division KSB3 bacterium TaxID=2044937 RepID=A0A2G6KAW5_9BACT|nr:MAG: hypothetical protein CSA56_13990 [candidate division KSB3 bacterium]
MVFIAMKLFFGGGCVVQAFFGGYVGSIPRFTVEMIMMLASSFFGGALVGFLSPGFRIFEPAIGAFLAVLRTLLYSVFTPRTR